MEYDALWVVFWRQKENKFRSTKNNNQFKSLMQEENRVNPATHWHVKKPTENTELKKDNNVFIVFSVFSVSSVGVFYSYNKFR